MKNVDISRNSNTNLINTGILSNLEEEIDISEENQEKELEKDENEEDENKEMKEFIIELIIHIRVMDNREEIKRCICHNHIIDENEKQSQDYDNIYIEKEIIPSIEIPITK